MRRGTTPTVTLSVTNTDGSPCDLSGQEIHVAFESGSKKLIKTEDDMTVTVGDTATTLSIPLSQAETLSFREGKTVRVQLRCKSATGKAQATNIGSFTADEILEEGEI